MSLAFHTPGEYELGLMRAAAERKERLMGAPKAQIVDKARLKKGAERSKILSERMGKEWERLKVLSIIEVYGVNGKARGLTDDMFRKAVELACVGTNISPPEVLSRSQNKHVVPVRHRTWMYLADQGFTITEISRVSGNDRSTVSHAVKRARKESRAGSREEGSSTRPSRPQEREVKPEAAISL